MSVASRQPGQPGRPELVSMQLAVPVAVRDRAKVVANQQGKTLNQLVLQLLADAGDKELRRLCEQELTTRPRRGRPSHKGDMR